MPASREDAQPLFDAVWKKLPAMTGEALGAAVTLGELALSEDPPNTEERYVAALTTGATPDDEAALMVYVIADRGIAIAFSGLLMMMQEKIIREKLENASIDEDDIDAMNECASQMGSAFNDALREFIGTDAHLVLAEGGLESPETLAGETEIWCATSTIAAGELHEGEFTLCIPKAMWPSEAKKTDPADGFELTAEEAAALREATLEGMSGDREVIMLLPVERERSEWEALFARAGLDVHVATDVHAVRRLCAEGRGGTLILDADACPSGALPALARLLAWQEVRGPVVVAASRPTRTHVVSCLASGAADYLCKPISDEELRTRLGEISA